VNFGHALKNTMVPVITITGLQLGSIIAFAIITETVFQWPGMGLLFIQAIQFVDVPIMAAYLMLIALVFVTINLIVDVLYFVVDPRLRVDSAGGTEHDRTPARPPTAKKAGSARAGIPTATCGTASARRSRLSACVTSSSSSWRPPCWRPGSRRTTRSTWRRSI
jgi:hypothetical protein